MLLKKQKKIIKEYFNKNMLDKSNSNYFKNYIKMWKEVEQVKDTEILTQDIERYIHDLEMNSI